MLVTGLDIDLFFLDNYLSIISAIYLDLYLSIQISIYLFSKIFIYSVTYLYVQVNASSWLGPLNMVEPIYGYIMPALISVTIIANSLILVVLSRYSQTKRRFYNRETNIPENAYQTPLPFYETKIINSLLNSIISVNHKKGEEIQANLKSLYPLLFLQCRITFDRLLGRMENPSICVSLQIKQSFGSVSFKSANPNLVYMDPPENALKFKILKRDIDQQRF